MMSRENVPIFTLVLVAFLLVFVLLNNRQPEKQVYEETGDVNPGKLGNGWRHVVELPPRRKPVVHSESEINQACNECRAWKTKEDAWKLKRDERNAILDAKTTIENEYKFTTSPEYPCESGLVDIGGPGDGKKITCINYPDNSPEGNYSKPGGCFFLSVGSNGDFTYEIHMNRVRPNCDIHTYDPTVKLTDEHMQQLKDRHRTTFHTTGVSDKVGTMSYGDLKPLTQIMKDLNRKHISVAKIDCETCEWDAFANDIFPAMKAGTLEINQLLIELHPIKPLEIFRLRDFMRGADEVGLRLFSYEFNHYTLVTKFWAAEFSFIYVKRPSGCDICPEDQL